MTTTLTYHIANIISSTTAIGSELRSNHEPGPTISSSTARGSQHRPHYKHGSTSCNATTIGKPGSTIASAVISGAVTLAATLLPVSFSF